MRQPRFLPMSRQEMDALGWDSLDVLLVSGDAYVDHPSFGAALLGRYLVSLGLRTGIVAQPRWINKEDALADMRAMGRPALFAGVAAGAIDSMLAHYTAFRKKRSDDAYTPGGQAGARPNRATMVYTGLVRQAFPGLPVILGGIEASLRRISHYDFWSDSLRRSILLDSKADLLVYGMGEKALADIAGKARALAEEAEPASTMDERPPRPGSGLVARADLVRACRAVPGIVWTASTKEFPAGNGIGALPSHEALLEEPSLLMRATLELEKQVHQGNETLVQQNGDRFIVVNPPAPLLTEGEMDALYALPFSRLPHPSYTRSIPAWEMIRTSITTHRGCGGGCSFCSLALHQGRRISSRSEESILEEARDIAVGPSTAGRPVWAHASSGSLAVGGSVPAEGTKDRAGGAAPKWAGSISDVGGPSANMWQAGCRLPEGKICSRASCLHPAACRFFAVDQKAGAAMLRAVARQEGVRHVRIASGVRFDLALQEPEALRVYTAEFTGGQLKVAPEHSENAVLERMRKPSLDVFEAFLAAFARYTGQSERELYTVPYLMSAFPGCTEEHMRGLSAWLRERRWKPQQVQCFIPTPGTVATAMYVAGIDPQGQPLYVARSDKERLRQHHMLFEESAGQPEKRQGKHQERRPERHKGKRQDKCPGKRDSAAGEGRERGSPTGGKRSGEVIPRRKKALAR